MDCQLVFGDKAAGELLDPVGFGLLPNTVEAVGVPFDR